jgi:hypothetical protein
VPKAWNQLVIILMDSGLEKVRLKRLGEGSLKRLEMDIFENA